ncbi:MAG: redox-sensing transcriptional repressor Rex [Peptostreptococcaceae bacterium]
MAEKNISMAVIRRLPKYHRQLGELINKEIKRISSKELSDITGFTASQIRQDLNNFGGFGQQGYGYNVDALHNEIEKILGLDKQYNAVVIGSGNLGQAIANYAGFNQSSFNIKALFDVDKNIIGNDIRDFKVLDALDAPSFIKENNINIAILCIPRKGAQETADKLVDAGITGIWNFSSIDLDVPSNIIIENVSITDSLFTLSYLMKEKR